MTEKRKDTALVRAAAKGGKEAFVALIDQYRQTMYATAMAVTRNEQDALDAIQDTILTLWEKLELLRDPGAFKTWMTRILVNRCRDRLRERSRELPGELPEGEASSPDTDLSLDVNRAMGELSEDDRLVLQLFYFEDMPVKEIAAALRISSEAVRMRLNRSRKRFQKQYEKEAVYEKE